MKGKKDFSRPLGENNITESLVLSVCIFLKVSLPSYRMKFVRFLLGREQSKVFGQQEVFYFKT